MRDLVGPPSRHRPPGDRTSGTPSGCSDLRARYDSRCPDRRAPIDGDIAEGLGGVALDDAGACLVIDRRYPADRSHGRRADRDLPAFARRRRSICSTRARRPCPSGGAASSSSISRPRASAAARARWRSWPAAAGSRRRRLHRAPVLSGRAVGRARDARRARPRVRRGVARGDLQRADVRRAVHGDALGVPSHSRRRPRTCRTSTCCRRPGASGAGATIGRAPKATGAASRRIERRVLGFHRHRRRARASRFRRATSSSFARATRR